MSEQLRFLLFLISNIYCLQVFTTTKKLHSQSCDSLNVCSYTLMLYLKPPPTPPSGYHMVTTHMSDPTIFTFKDSPCVKAKEK